MFLIGIQFFILQILATIAFSGDNLIVAQLLSPDAVAELGIVTRMFSFVPMLIEMLMGPLWPAYAEASSRGDSAWIERTLRRSLCLAALIASCVATVLIIFGKGIVHLWVGSSINPPLLLLVGSGVWTLLYVLGIAVAMFLNGTNNLKFQVLCGSAAALTALVLKLLLIPRIGLPGVVWGMVFAYTLFNAVPMMFYVPRLLDEMRSRLKTEIVR